MADLNTNVSDLDEGETFALLGNDATITSTRHVEQFCADCNGMAQMPHVTAKALDGDVTIKLRQCPHCDGLGYTLTMVRGGNGVHRGGIMRLTRDEEDDRLLALRDEGHDVWLDSRGGEVVEVSA